MVLHGFAKQIRYEGFIQEPNQRNGDLLVCRKTARELAPADFTALIDRYYIENKNPLRHLPATQSAAAKLQQINFGHARCSDHTCRYFLIPQRRSATKHNRLTHAAKAQQVRLQFYGIHFLPGYVDYVGNSASDPKSMLRFR